MLVAACGSHASSRTDAGNGSTLKIAQDGVLPNIDPINASNVTVDEVAVAIYENLADYDATGKLVGRLAAKWVVAPDGRSIKFTLRDGATFHDGSPVTAADVAYSFDRIKKVGVGVSGSISLYDGADVLDDKNVSIKLKSPSSLFTGYLSKIYILNSKLVKQHEGSDNGQAWLATHDAGSGPYMLDTYQPNQQVVLKKYTKFNGALDPKIAGTVVIKLIQQAAATRDEMLTGGIDVTRNIEGPDLAQFDKNPKYHIAHPGNLKMLYVFFNTQKGATKDKRVREAIRYAYDYAGHIKTINNGQGAPASGVLPKAMSCSPNLPPMAQDLDRAKKLVQQAGATGLTLTMQYQTFADEFNAAAVSLQSSLKQIGINLKLQSVTYPTYLQELHNVATTPEMAMSWYNPPTPDPGSVLSVIFSSKTVDTGANLGQYSNPEVDQLIDKAIPSTDDAFRCDTYKKIQGLLDQDSAAMAMVDENDSTVVSRLGINGTDTSHPGHIGLLPQILTVG